MKGRIRIFVTTSHVSTVYMTLQALSTNAEGDIDILLIDVGTRRNKVVELIRQTSQFHQWDIFHSFSAIADSDHDFEPTFSKRLTRKWKGAPGLRPIYNYLYHKRQKNVEQDQKKKLSQILAAHLNSENIELFMMTQTHLNIPLQELFPKAFRHYMEHGIGDYLYVTETNATRRTFHSLFHTPFVKYLRSKGVQTDWIFPISGIENFTTLSTKLLKQHETILHLDSIVIPDKPIVFILLEAVDMYDVPKLFWKAYIDQILSKIDAPSNYHYLLKTHPIQSLVSIAETESHFRDKGLSYTLLSNDSLSSASAEVVFSKWADRTKHVFCLFSSGCFYLSQLYPDRNIQFWYSTEFMSRYISNAPPQSKDHFQGLRPIIEHVLAEKCNSY